MTDEDMKALGSRRDFFKKMVALGVAIPVISSFALEGVAAADGNNYNFNYGNGGYDDHDHRHHHHHHHHRHNNGGYEFG